MLTVQELSHAKVRGVNITARKHIYRTRIVAGVTNEQIPIVKTHRLVFMLRRAMKERGETIQQNFSEEVKRKGMQTFKSNNLLL